MTEGGGWAARLDELLDAAEGADPGRVAPSVSAVVWVDGQERYVRHADRVYDLASLTKPLCTAELALGACAAGAFHLDAGHRLLPAGVTLRHLLQHASGWPAWRPFHATCRTREEVIARVLATPLEAPPGARHVYSDLGFIALGAVLEAEAGARIDRLWEGPLRWGDPRAETTGEGRGGPVHDENARAMGGIAPHAGLYGTAREVAACVLRWVRADRLPAAWVSRAWTEHGPGSHTLGWDTPSPGGPSTAGAHPPADAVGHLGFTGTSIWASPSTGVISVLLTNRVMHGPDTVGIRALRQAFHGEAWATSREGLRIRDKLG